MVTSARESVLLDIEHENAHFAHQFVRKPSSRGIYVTACDTYSNIAVLAVDSPYLLLCDAFKLNSQSRRS